MDWKTLLSEVLEKLTTAALVAGVVVWLGKLFVQKFFESGVETLKAELKRRNDLALTEARHALSLQMLDARSVVERAAATDERLRVEILAWVNPVLDAVRGLERRLDNILHQQGYRALDAGAPQPDPNWSVTYDYFVGSTVYLFGCYFCWVRTMELELSFELLRARAAEAALFDALSNVARTLGDYPPLLPGAGHDVQVFRLQQRAMGELLVARRGERRACVSYATFLTRWTGGAYGAHFDPVVRLVDDVRPGERRWNRLLAVHAAVRALRDECERLLRPTP